MGLLGNGLGWPHLLIILALVLLLFGAPKLPGLAKSLGQSMRIFKGEMKAMKSDDTKGDQSSTANTDADETPQPQHLTSSTEAHTDQATDTKPPSKS